MSRSGWTRWRTGVATLVALSTIASGCGSGGGDDEAGSTSTTAPSEPQHGGNLTYGLVAETDGWDPTASRWAPSGFQVARSFYDTLMEYDASGRPVPSLAESMEPNDDFTEWVVTLREGVRFHNGEVLDAAALKAQLDAYKASPLVGTIFYTTDRNEVVDERRVRIVLNEPVTLLPHLFTTQLGVVMAPEALADPARAQHPIGTGPFVFESWEPDASLVVRRNEDYWQEGLPYLDRIEFQPIVSGQSRVAALQSGDVNIAEISEPAGIRTFQELAAEGDFQVFDDTIGETDESFVQLNTAVPPFDDPTVRRALATATDAQAFVDDLHDGFYEVARGPYRESSAWYAETDYPTYDPEAARRMVEEWEAANGPLRFTVVTAGEAGQRESAQYLAQMWAEAGIEADVQSVDQTQLIVSVISGQFQATIWSQFGSRHPFMESAWWHEHYVTEIPQVSLNMARNRDAELSAALDDLRKDPTGERAKIDVDIVQGRLAADIPYVWLFHTEQVRAASNDIHDVFAATTPDGEPAQPLTNGAHGLAQVWMSPS